VNSVGVVVYGQAAPSAAPQVSGFIKEASWRGASPDSTHLHLELAQPLWGFKAFFSEDGALVVRIRKLPTIDASNPLRDLRIMVDSGHPPGGAIGPTGPTEAEANLTIALELADPLRNRGAEVVMTRTTESGLVSDSLAAPELWARVDLAVAEDVDLLISVHNNAFPDGVNPFLNYGTETYYFHPFSTPFAAALQRHLVEATGLPNLGAKQRSLALVRPS
jgi:N-acetylmuramoyl-L-alanine amidase